MPAIRLLLTAKLLQISAPALSIAGRLAEYGSICTLRKILRRRWRKACKQAARRYGKARSRFNLYWSLGRRGERVARRYLIRKGYFVRHHNWACKIGELDLIVQKDNTLVFVEVKTRTAEVDRWFSAIDAVDEPKQKRIEKLAAWYEQDFWRDIRYRRLRKRRFDVITITMRGRLQRPSIKHYQEGFLS